jgi:uncharacterized protein (DUF983 family)
VARQRHQETGKPLRHTTWEKMEILFSRALLLRCPACAQSGLFAGVYELKRTCPGCGLLLQREGDGYELGGMVVNIFVGEFLWAALFAAILFLTWPNPPWTLLQWGSPVFMIALPLLFLRHARVLSLALDMLFRPIERSELQRPPERRRRG